MTAMQAQRLEFEERMGSGYGSGRSWGQREPGFGGVNLVFSLLPRIIAGHLMKPSRYSQRLSSALLPKFS